MAQTFRSSDASHPWVLLREVDDFGLPAYDLVRPPGRFWSDGTLMPPVMRGTVDAQRVKSEPLPTELLRSLPPKDNWQAMTRRSLHRLRAWFLVTEDPQGRLDAQPVATLAHQVSLVHHIIQEPHLQSVLIADEVGLGKTIEAALLVKHLLAAQPGLRVLYLAPARLVSNVRRELDRVGLRFRSWVAGPANDTQLDDALVIASIHRAVVGDNFDAFLKKSRWDVLIVDECHHLSAWGPNGGSSARKYRLVSELRTKLPPSGRLILLSGTPHQGHNERFQNVLRLLCRPGEEVQAVAGRVIFRTKDDVRDWEGRPLFPTRKVNQPIVLELGPAHRAWLESIHHLFAPEAPTARESSRRAAGWRCGQAMQWATSSIEAGLGYLVRQAMRAGWTPKQRVLADALAALRPYRSGAPDEPVGALFMRIARELQVQADSGTIEDIEGDDDQEDVQSWAPDDKLLTRALVDGLALLAGERDTKWDALRPLLTAAGREKVVLFAQPIETVMALVRYLERTDGATPALIIGDQSEEERQAQVAAFWRHDGPQFLVSSRAGGEGLNLQVARRLVHVDVPWNPMELEQRVGRVHRFMSRKQIIIDTLVVKDSREADMYEVARAKMREVASALAPDDARFEALFARVMSVVPPSELQGVLSQGATGPLSREQRSAVGELVAEGLRNWSAFHQRYADKKRQIDDLPPGEASWNDLAEFAVEVARGVRADPHRALAFERRGDDVVAAELEAQAVRIGDVTFGVGDYGGMPVVDAQDRPLRSLGLNTPELQTVLREAAFPEEYAGAAQVRWPEGEPRPVPGKAPFAVLALVRIPIRLVDGGAQELGPELRVWAGGAHPLPEVEGRAKGELVRGLLAGTLRREAEDAPELIDALQATLHASSRELRTPSTSERTYQIRAAVFPLLAAIVT
ncbi:MAG: DEAD/DEAH box helicase [Deltaproteobacteria bacterium]|nr:DEAD/DEAH box helicase [Deltaproteobacteria bacterium]